MAFGGNAIFANNVDRGFLFVFGETSYLAKQKV
jgi:hypothetical protein